MIQVYTGDGKGKTTAAIGLAIRASGAGLKVYFAQFLKKGCYSEIKQLNKIKNITLEQFGRGCFIKFKPQSVDIKLAQKGFTKIKKIICSGKYKVIILDEINAAVKLNLIALNELVTFLKEAPKDIELVLTGRDTDAEILQLADLVSEIKDVKHYYTNGVKARKGIEF